MRQQCGPASVIKGSEPLPERRLVLRQIGLLSLVPLRDRLRRRAVDQVR